MAIERPLARPPIQEALVDIRIASDSTIDAARLASLRNSLIAGYPKCEEKRRFQAQMRLEAGKVLPPSTVDLGFHGLVFSTADGTRLAQFRPDGFTLNQLRPYGGADALIREALRLWEQYVELAAPNLVVRIALRYVNALELPYHYGDDFGRFLTSAPQLPEGAPQSIGSFLSRIVAGQDDEVIVVTQSLAGAPAGKPAPVTIDLDAFVADVSLPPKTEPIEAVLQRLRALKNRVFFALLTDEAVGLYE